MIRQAISCDVCGAEKKQTNHWFVACEQAGEMRVSGWTSRNRLRSGSKHLCGQTCLHKLLDEFLARTLEGRSVPEVTENAAEEREVGSASVASKVSFLEEESSACVLLPTPVPQRVAPPAALAATARVMEAPRPIVLPRREEPAADVARRRRAEAWERERARELRVVERRPN